MGSRCDNYGRKYTRSETHQLLLSALLECVEASPTRDSGTAVVGVDSIVFSLNNLINGCPGHVHSKSGSGTRGDTKWSSYLLHSRALSVILSAGQLKNVL
jgi:hypothetical protein